MSQNDYLGLDGNTLTTFLTVLEEMSVSRAAERLGVTQSAVSHTLEKLRVITSLSDARWFNPGYMLPPLRFFFLSVELKS